MRELRAGGERMSALITTPFDSWVIFPAKPGFQSSVHFYWGAAWDRVHEMPLGAVFGVVSSPSQFSTFPHWSYTRFQVRLCTFRAGQPPERGYADVSHRDLTAEEIEHFKNEWHKLEAQSE